MENKKRFKHSTDFYRRRSKTLDLIPHNDVNKIIQFESVNVQNEIVIVDGNENPTSDTSIIPQNHSSNSEKSLSEERTSEDDQNESKQYKFNEKLRRWAVSNNETHTSVNQLLLILREQGMHELPRDARTLLHTPINISLIEMGNGEYWYNGVENNLRIALKDISEPQTISIRINVDGMSPFKSSGKELWPILFAFNGQPPMAAAVYYGHGKPPLNEFMSPFIAEINYLIETGLVINMQPIKLRILCWICDTPARSYIKGKYI